MRIGAPALLRAEIINGCRLFSSAGHRLLGSRDILSVRRVMAQRLHFLEARQAPTGSN
jgi:hypothetical protein